MSWHAYECTVTVRFSDEDVVEWLSGNGELSEEEEADYTPTEEQREEYAWYRIECDEGEYDSVIKVR